MEALQYQEMEQGQAVPVNFILVQTPLLEDKNIRQLGDYLRQEGMEAEYQSYRNLMQDTDQLGMLLAQLTHTTDALNQERAAHKETAKRLDEMTDRMGKLEQTLYGMQKNLDNYENVSETRFSERMNALKSGFVNLKAGIKERVNDLLLDLKANGKGILGRISEVLDVKGKLAWMCSCVQNGVYEMNKNIDRQNRMHAQYQKAAEALTQAGNIRHEDRFSQAGDPVRLILQKREETGARRIERMESRRDNMQNLCRHLADSIGRVEAFEKDALKAKQIRMADRLQQAERNNRRMEAMEAFRDEEPQLE